MTRRGTAAQAPDLRIALIQLKIRDGEPSCNMERALDLIGAAPNADVFVLPELWTTGYAHRSWASTADDHTPACLEALRSMSEDRGAWIVGSMISRRRDGALANRLWLVRSDGAEPVWYDKAHLFEPMGEVERLAAGDRRVRTRIGDWTMALSLCYDLRFPEMYRLDAVDGADLFLVSAQWPAERQDTMRLLARSRAAENQAYLALCNRTGAAEDGTRFRGGSMIVAPSGDVVAELAEDEGTAVCTIALSRVRSSRAAIPVIDRRQPGVDYD